MGNRVGEVLASKYRLEELLGSGGMGHVYRAVNQLVGRAVAIKVLRREHAQNTQVVERFLREARAANLVRHPNVVDVLDIGTEDGGAPFIVQELLEGEDLAHLVERRGGKLPVDEVAELLGPVIEAVAVAHHAGVVHRDIKPENVFLVRGPRGPIPKLLDFGISKITAPDLRATDVGVMMGTPAYMAPEQIHGSREADPRSDVWAIGIMLFELIAGRMPFDAQDAPQLFLAIATKDAPTLLDVGVQVTPAISRVVERCLRRQPNERYPTAAALARDLQHAVDGSDLEPTGRHSIPPSLRPNARQIAPDLAIPKAAGAPAIPHDGVDAKGDTIPGHGFPGSERGPAAAPVKATVAVAVAVAEPAPAPAAVPDTTPKAPSLLPPAPRLVSKAPVRAPAPAPVTPSRAPASAPASSRSIPMEPRSGRVASSASLPGVGLAPGQSSMRPAASRAGSREAWDAPPEPRERADLSPIIGLGVVGLVAILGTGLLMKLAHRPEGWPLAALFAPTPGIAFALHVVLALGVLGVGLTCCRKGVRHWRGDLGGGHSGAIFNGVVASGAFFSAIELISAVS